MTACQQLFTTKVTFYKIKKLVKAPNHKNAQKQQINAFINKYFICIPTKRQQKNLMHSP